MFVWGGPFWPDTLTGLGLAAITYVGQLLSFLFVEIYFYLGPLNGHASRTSFKRHSYLFGGL